MKIIIELSEAQVKGIKKYLKEVEDIENPTSNDILKEIKGMISSELQHGAVYDYIKKYEKPL